MGARWQSGTALSCTPASSSSHNTPQRLEDMLMFESTKPRRLPKLYLISFSEAGDAPLIVRFVLADGHHHG